LPEPVRFLAPGAAAVDVAQPGTYVLWHEHRTVFDGKTFDAEAQLPGGLQFRANAPDGRRLDLRASNGSVKSGSAERVAVVEFVAPAPGRYRVAVQGQFEPRVFSISRSLLAPIFRAVGGAVAALVFGIGGAIALALYGFLRHGQFQSVSANQATGDEREKSLRQTVAVVYGLQAVSLLVGLTLIAAVIVDYLKRAEVEGTWLESHVRWQIRTFWWSLAWGVLGLATLVLLVGLVILAAATVWFIYRVARGWTDLNEGRPMYPSVT
jgi:uncharacterized membrane protein